jgi:hypothetical protein
MKCGKPANVDMILIGLHQVGVIGLRDALKKAAESGLEEREEITDFLLTDLSRENYFPNAQIEACRLALWREHLRFHGEDIRPFFTSMAVDVRGAAGDERDRFVETLLEIFHGFELNPQITYHPPDGDDPTPELLIEGEPIVRGCLSEAAFKAAVRRRIGEW